MTCGIVVKIDYELVIKEIVYTDLQKLVILWLQKNIKQKIHQKKP